MQLEASISAIRASDFEVWRLRGVGDGGVQAVAGGKSDCQYRGRERYV